LLFIFRSGTDFTEDRILINPEFDFTLFVHVDHLGSDSHETIHTGEPAKTLENEEGTIDGQPMLTIQWLYSIGVHIELPIFRVGTHRVIVHHPHNGGMMFLQSFFACLLLGFRKLHKMSLYLFTRDDVCENIFLLCMSFPVIKHIRLSTAPMLLTHLLFILFF
jgi:hypothetical protein